ncbi:MAG TPA: hypothetical protein VNJ01_14990 [Bacteriovoracaceae bacterium]|nr:hypothetical protein [Bacteriovoracaceae bacterium]
MKHFIVSVATIIALSALVVSCGGDESSSPGVVTTGLSMTGSGQPAVVRTNFNKIFSLLMPSAIALPPAPLVDSTGTSVTMNDAWIVIKSIEFEANEISDGSEVDGDEVELAGPFHVDLLSSLPLSFGDVQVPASGLRRIKMKLHKVDALPAGAPAALNNNSIYLTFTRGLISFTYLSDDTAKFEIGGPNPVVPNNTEDLLVEIKTADLIKKIDLSGISNGTIITASARFPKATPPCPLIQPSATDLYTCFRKGLETQADFGSDDGDFDLDANDESVD